MRHKGRRGTDLRPPTTRGESARRRRRPAGPTKSSTDPVPMTWSHLIRSIALTSAGRRPTLPPAIPPSSRAGATPGSRHPRYRRKHSMRRAKPRESRFPKNAFPMAASTGCSSSMLAQWRRWHLTQALKCLPSSPSLSSPSSIPLWNTRHASTVKRRVPDPCPNASACVDATARVGRPARRRGHSPAPGRRAGTHRTRPAAP